MKPEPAQTIPSVHSSHVPRPSLVLQSLLIRRLPAVLILLFLFSILLLSMDAQQAAAFSLIALAVCLCLYTFLYLLHLEDRSGEPLLPDFSFSRSPLP